jgi:hypothetical protein
MIKSIEPYSSTKGILREEVCLRLIKPTTQVYLGNVGLLTLFVMKVYLENASASLTLNSKGVYVEGMHKCSSN